MSNMKHNFTITDIDAIRSFIELAYYNGYEDDIKDIKNSLKKISKHDIYGYAVRPDWKSKCGRYKFDEFGGIFWSWLVLQYGEYGTSPRFGWIYEENANEIIAIIELIEKEWHVQ